MRAAIIGCGPTGPARGGVHSIAYAHGWAMRNAGRDVIQLVAAASRDAKNVHDFVAEFPGVAGYQDYREMLARERPDFVSICAFPPDREAMTRAALEVGAKVLWVEKPFAVSMAAADQMMADAKAHGARLFVNFQRRYGQPFERMRTAVQGGRIGPLTGAQVTQPGNVLVNFGPHLIDAALYILGAPGTRRPEHIFAAGTWAGEDEKYQGLRVEEQLIGTVHFSDGARLVVESGRQVAGRVPIIRFDGEEGFAELRLVPLDGEQGVARGRFRGASEIEVCDTEENFHHGPVDRNLYVDRALQDILAAVEKGQPTRLDAEAVLPGLEVLLGLFAAARAGRMISLPLTERGSPFSDGR